MENLVAFEKAFEKHQDEVIKEMHERFITYRMKKKRF